MKARKKNNGDALLEAATSGQMRPRQDEWNVVGGGPNFPRRGQKRTFPDSDEAKFFWMPPNSVKVRHLGMGQA
jgi:hypothetical protein